MFKLRAALRSNDNWHVMSFLVSCIRALEIAGLCEIVCNLRAVEMANRWNVGLFDEFGIAKN
jgi:hypothetical protein